MDSFTYNNIFETKGIEYIIIIAFLLLIIPFWQVITRPVVREKIAGAVSYLTDKVLRIPRGLLYGRNHTWAHLSKGGDAVVGIDDLLNHIVGRVNVNPARKEGDTIRRGEKIAELQSGERTLDILSPLSGRIITYNELLASNPALLLEQPYEKGWMVKVEPVDWIRETSDFVTGEDADRWEREEYMRFRDFIVNTQSVPGQPLLQEGGELTDHPLSGMPEEVWYSFQKQFLNI